jgi:pyrimidine-nucleoside phosphorylase
MLHLSRGVTLEAARAEVREALRSGAGLEKLRQVIELQGGDPRVCDGPSRLPRAPETVVVRSERDGRVARIAARAVGRAAMLLGAGRETVDGTIDPGVGLLFHKKVGDPVAVNEPIVTVHLGSKAHLDAVLALLRGAIEVRPQAPPSRRLVIDILT